MLRSMYSGVSGLRGYQTMIDVVGNNIANVNTIGFKGGLAMESFINMPPEVAYGLAVWRPVAKDEEEVMGNGLPFLRNKAKQYGLI